LAIHGSNGSMQQEVAVSAAAEVESENRPGGQPDTLMGNEAPTCGYDRRHANDQLLT